MGKFDHEKEIEDIVDIIKDDIRSLDTTIKNLVTEAQNRSGALTKYHDLTSPLTKLMTTKQKHLDQLLKIMSSFRTGAPPAEDEVVMDMSEMYAKFEVEK